MRKVLRRIAVGVPLVAVLACASAPAAEAAYQYKEVECSSGATLMLAAAGTPNCRRSIPCPAAALECRFAATGFYKSVNLGGRGTTRATILKNTEPRYAFTQVAHCVPATGDGCSARVVLEGYRIPPGSLAEASCAFTQGTLLLAQLTCRAQMEIYLP